MAVANTHLSVLCHSPPCTLFLRRAPSPISSSFVRESSSGWPASVIVHAVLLLALALDRPRVDSARDEEDRRYPSIDRRIRCRLDRRRPGVGYPSCFAEAGRRQPQHPSRACGTGSARVACGHRSHRGWQVSARAADTPPRGRCRDDRTSVVDRGGRDGRVRADGVRRVDAAGESACVRAGSASAWD